MSRLSISFSFLIYCHLRCSLDGNLVKSCNVLSSDQAKLTRLYQYLAGEARLAVKAFAQIGGGAGYVKTRQVLKCRFGRSHLVAQCVIDDLRKGDPATKPTEPRALADEIASSDFITAWCIWRGQYATVYM